MAAKYTSEANVGIVISLMKHHGVKRVIASPGVINIPLVASLQNDSFFEIYSAVDERSAAYMACGMAAETGEPVALSCTGATASRNYLPGLTEAYYRKLPVLAITSARHLGCIGQMVPQVIDRTAQLNDICRLSVQVPSVQNAEDRRFCEMSVNRALLTLRQDGGGPAHINLVTMGSQDFSADSLPAVHPVDILGPNDDLPCLDGRQVGVFVGNHARFDEKLTQVLDSFCAAYDAAVICDHTSNYHGFYHVHGGLLLAQTHYVPKCKSVDVLVHIGEVSGAYYPLSAKEVWRVSPDGEPRDPFGGLRYVFKMGEAEFFDLLAQRADASANKNANENTHRQLDRWKAEDQELRSCLPDLPFSNPWCASRIAPLLPQGSVLHLGILNSLRAWNMFEITAGVDCFCNTGGFGIDGCVSSLIGASIASPERLFFGVVGDLACFYDLNSLGNRHIASNLRLLVVNNGVGTEFKHYNNFGAEFGSDADDYIAAMGHFGAQSPDLLRHYAADLGFEYLCANDKDSFAEAIGVFVDPVSREKPVLFEVFTNWEDESNALYSLKTLRGNPAGFAKGAAKSILGEKGIRTVKRILGK